MPKETFLIRLAQPCPQQDCSVPQGQTKLTKNLQNVQQIELPGDKGAHHTKNHDTKCGQGVGIYMALRPQIQKQILRQLQKPGDQKEQQAIKQRNDDLATQAEGDISPPASFSAFCGSVRFLLMPTWGMPDQPGRCIPTRQAACGRCKRRSGTVRFKKLMDALLAILPVGRQPLKETRILRLVT